MLRTRVGYSGGTTDKPTYRSMGDHTEAIQIEYDPKKVSFSKLLELFAKDHNPFAKSWSTQYKAVLWTHGAEQAKAAQAWATALAKERGKSITTEIRPAQRFWIAEGYHQKYYLRSRKYLLQELLGISATDKQILDSTLAACANGWVTGAGDAKQIEREAKILGLNERQRKALKDALGKRAEALCR